MDEKEFEKLMPAAVCVEEGKTYYWCGCGDSTNQPLCDKLGVCKNAVLFKAPITDEVYFCNCKQTKNPPWCDGSHGRVLVTLIKQKQQE